MHDLPPGAPDTVPDIYTPYLALAAQCSTWKIFTDYIDAHIETIERPNRPASAIYREHGERAGMAVPEATRPVFDELLAEYSDARPCSPAHDDVIRAWCQHAVGWVPIPEIYSSHHDDFWWAPVRMLLAGFGFARWEMTAGMLSRDDRCPFQPDEEKDDWERAIRLAHVSSGWPLQLTGLPYDQLHRLFADEPGGTLMDPFPPDWLAPLAYLHVLKYIRRAPSGHLVVLYRGQRVLIDAGSASNYGGLSTQAKGQICRALRVTSRAEKDPDWPWWSAFATAINEISFIDLLPTRAIADLPPDVVAGPWSTLRRDPTPHSRQWIHHGVVLDGVKRARPHAASRDTGVVTDVMRDDSLILRFHWNLTDAGSADRNLARDRMWDTLPRTYRVTEMPFDVLLKFFPNISESARADERLLAATRSVYDSALFASLLRQQVPALAREFPIVAFLPWTATIESSTNTGKTSAAVTWGRAMCPTLPLQASSSPDSNSAPDKRTIVTQLLEHGTVVLDEFVPPRTDHPLAKRHLQTLATGGVYNGGLALQNDGRVSLRHSLVMSAKAITRWGPDMITRTYPVWLGPLTDDQRLGRGEASFEDIASGRAAMEIRFAAWSILEAQPVLDLLRGIRASGTERARFNCHFALAQLCLQLRTGVEADTEEARTLIDRAMEGLHARLLTHADQAIHSGVEEEMESTHATRLHMSSFHGVISPDFLADWLDDNRSPSVEDWIRAAPGNDGLYDSSLEGIVRWWHQTTGARFPSFRRLVTAAESMLAEYASRHNSEIVEPPPELRPLARAWRRTSKGWVFAPLYTHLPATAPNTGKDKGTAS